jgi:hypothetical protein
MDVVGFRDNRLSWFGLILLLLGQGFLLLRLLGASDTFQTLTDDRPIVDGHHPLHLYHGQLGAASWKERLTPSCYDPAFQAGYAKSPVYDADCRWAQLTMLIGGDHPSAYKIGFLLGLLPVPWLFALASRGLGLGAWGSLLGGLFGMALLWSPPGYLLLQQGEIDLILGGLALIIYLTWWIRYSLEPSLLGWFVLLISATVAWNFQPVLMLILFPVLALYYFWEAFRHGLVWHLSLISVSALPIIINVPFGLEWAHHLIDRLPSERELIPSVVEFSLTQWVPMDPIHLALGAIGLVGLFGLFAWRVGIGLLLSITVVSWLFLIGGERWFPIVRELGGVRLQPLPFWLLTGPGALVFTTIAERIHRSVGIRSFGVAWVLIAISGLGWWVGLPNYLQELPPLTIGLSEPQKQIIVGLRTLPATRSTSSNSEGRILWEDPLLSGPLDGWTALLNVYTQREFIGGLDATSTLPGFAVRLVDGKLIEREISNWTDLDLTTFLNRYNITAVVCKHPASIQRFNQFPLAKRFKDLPEQRVLFMIDRVPNLFLKGSGRIESLDWQRIALADVVPDEGEIILSLHYQSGWRIAPSYVQVDKQIEPPDRVGLFKLRLPAPISRLTLVWEGR